jgi:hypothetical protein
MRAELWLRGANGRMEAQVKGTGRKSPALMGINPIDEVIHG